MFVVPIEFVVMFEIGVGDEIVNVTVFKVKAAVEFTNDGLVPELA